MSNISQKLGADLGGGGARGCGRTFRLFFQIFACGEKNLEKIGVFLVLWVSSEYQFGRSKKKFDNFFEFFKKNPPLQENPRSAPDENPFSRDSNLKKLKLAIKDAINVLEFNFPKFYDCPICLTSRNKTCIF